MGEILEFRSRTNNYDSEVLGSFCSVIKKYNYGKNSCDPNKDDSDKELDFLFVYLSKLINKHRNQSWKTEKVQERYISLVDDLDIQFKKNKNMKAQIVFDEFMLTYLFDIYPKLAYESPKYIMKITDGFDLYMRNSVERDSNKNIEKLKFLVHPQIRKLIEKNYNDNYIVAEIIYKIEEGYNIQDIISYFNEKTYEQKEESVSLDVGFINIDKIREYYENQAGLLYNSIINDKNLELELKPFNIYRNLGYLYAIDRFDDEHKLFFIDMINDIRSMDVGLIEELKFVSTASEVYKFYGNNIINMDYKLLSNLIAYKIFNNCSMEEVDDFRKHIEKNSNKKI